MGVPPQKGLESSSQIKFFFLGWQAAHRIGIVGFPMRVPPQKGLESSSQIKFFFLGWQAAHRIGIVGFPNARPSTERSRKFFSNKVFLLGVAGSTQNRHSRLPKCASLHRNV